MQVACGYTIPITLFGIPPSPADHLKAMEIVGQAGFKLIELELYDELVEEHRRDIPQMQAILKKHGMRCASVMAVEEKMFSLDPATKRKALADFDQLAGLIAELGSPLVTICGYMPPEIRPQGTQLYVGGPPTSVTVNDDFSWTAFWANAVDVFKQCAAMAKRHGLTLLIETRANDVFSSTDALMNLIRESGAEGSRRDPRRGPCACREGIPRAGHSQIGQTDQTGSLFRQRRHPGLPLLAREGKHRLSRRLPQSEARGL